MMNKEKLTAEAIAEALRTLSGWTVADGKLHREYKFPDFPSAFGFMAAAATTIEKMNHHPEWCNVYSTVTVDLSTHDAGGITSMDTKLAASLEKIAQKLL